MNPISPPLAPRSFSWDTGSLVFGGVWVALVTDAFFRFVGALGGNSLEQTVVHGASFGGTVTNAFQWADSVGLLSLGSYLPLAQALGFGSSAIISFFGTLEARGQLVQIPADAVDLHHQKRLALLNLGARVTMLAWSLLCLASFFAGAPLIPTFTSGLLLTSFFLFIAGGVYRGRLLPPNPAPQE